MRCPFLQLRRAVVDHVSDSFLETTVPLLMLIEAAQAGNEREVEECAKLFIDHAAKLEEVSLWFVVVRRLKTQFWIIVIIIFFYTTKMKMMHLQIG